MLFLPNRQEFLRIKNNLLASTKNWNSQYSSDKWSVSDDEPEKYPCYIQMAPTIKYQYQFFFFYDN